MVCTLCKSDSLQSLQEPSDKLVGGGLCGNACTNRRGCSGGERASIGGLGGLGGVTFNAAEGSAGAGPWLLKPLDGPGAPSATRTHC